LTSASQRSGVVLRKAQRVQVLDRGVGVKNTHHHLLAKRRGQRGQAHFNLVAARVARLDAAVLRAALFHHVHAAQQLDARVMALSTPMGIW
jgi:hypothetical protein